MTDGVTKLLIDWKNGDSTALDRLMPLVYDELHRLARGYMRRERSDHTLQPTALVHEAYMRLIDQTRIDWRGRAQFIAVAAQLMRRITMNYARHHQATKRAGQALRVTLTDDAVPAGTIEPSRMLELDEVLLRLRQLDERQCQIVELRFFGGLRSREIQEVLGVSRSTIDREWRIARAWLKRELTPA